MDPEDLSRPRGILTKRDREYLLANKHGMSDKTEAQKRYRIRQRVFHAILDFTLLVKHLPKSDREQVFEYDATDADRDYFTEAVQDALVFLYLGEGRDSFRTLLRFAIEEAQARQGTTVKSADIDIDIKRGVTIEEFERERDRLGVQLALERLTRTEVNQLWDASVISDEEYETYRMSL